MKNNKNCNNKNKRLLFIISFLCMCLIAACSSKSDNQQTKNQSSTVEEKNVVERNVTTEDNNDIQPLLKDSDQNTDNPLDESTKQDMESLESFVTKEILIYTINETTSEVEVVPALISNDSEITPELIVEKVTDSLVDRLVMVGIDQVTTDDDTVIVSFLSNQPPLTNVGSGLETTILDAFAQSLVDNLEDYPKVIFREEGEAYSSGHYKFGIDQVYLDGSKTN